jgi:hypothetical protein
MSNIMDTKCYNFGEKTQNIIIFVILVCFLFYYMSDNEEHLIVIPKINKDSIKWTKRNNCDNSPNKITTLMLNELNISNVADNNESNLIFPCGYNNIDKEINLLPLSSNNESQRVFIIDGADEITAKNNLWKNIRGYHGLEKALTLSPNTYILSGTDKMNEFNRLLTNHQPEKFYIMKKNIQRQKGLYITNDIYKIKNNIDNYVIAQELLQNPYLVNGRKINLRVYVVVLCYKSNTDVYMFNDGFMYYTKNHFIKNNNDMDNHITTGYVERSVYTENPLTHADFKKYLDLQENKRYYSTNPNRKYNDTETYIKKRGLSISDYVFNNIKRLLADVFISFKGKICRYKSNDTKLIPIYTNYTVQIFGADVAINDKLEAQIMEINKGPDLSPKDKRDEDLKKKLINDIFEIIGVKSISDNNGLVDILEM